MTPRKPRDPLDYAVEELEWRIGMLKEIGPATDNPKYSEWKVRALELAVERLRWPRFEVSPFL